MTQNGSVPELLAGESSLWHDLYEEDASQAQHQFVDAPGELIGPYRVLRSLGQGGMGEVFLAERADEQFEQRVAIKLVRRGLLSKQVQSRLRVERQILASLEHPNIARLLDGGSTKDGIPYIVMEHIDGEPIDVYCDQHRLNVRQRLSVFRSVCDAVHSAHQNLIVHRDLKPSNILVTAGGVPKLLDFGIAKMLDARQLTQTVALTEADFRMLTPDHASPEQLTGDLITTASDTYVLGVLLYELLTGCKPFTVKGRSFAELERIICEETPPPPHQIFSGTAADSTEQLAQIIANRSTTLAKLRRELQGDLSSIILMALRKEPERRYGSVRQFSEDIDRYLQGLPVNARMDTWLYRTAKFVKRHAVVVGLAAVLAVTLAGSTIFMYLNSKEVRRQSARAQDIAAVLIKLLNSPNPDEARSTEPTILEFLETAPQRIRTELAGQRDVQAELLNIIGLVFMRRGRYDQAQPLFEESWDILRRQLQLETPVVAEVAINLAELHMQDDYAKAEQFFRISMDISSQTEGAESRGVARGICGLGYVQARRNDYVGAETRLRQCLAMYQALPNVDASEIAIALDALAGTLAASGNLIEAESIYRQWLASVQDMPADSPRLLDQQQNLATVLQRRGELQEAIGLYRKVVDGVRKVWPGSERLVDVLTNYGWAQQELEQFAAADASFQEAQSINASLTSVSDVNRAYLMGRRAGLALDRAQLQDAETLYRDALEILLKAQSKRFTGSVLSGLGKTLVRSNRPVQAEQYVRQALPLLENGSGKNSYLYGSAQAILGRALWQQGKHAQGQALLREGHDRYVKQRGRNLPEARLLQGWLDEARAAAPNSSPTR
jgi:serine/threonine-protein kinase